MIYLGVSREFSNIIDCKKYYLQALRALEFRKVMGDENPIVLYSDVQFYDTLSSAYAAMEYKEYCNPILIKLKEYDKKTIRICITLYFYI